MCTRPGTAPCQTEAGLNRLNRDRLRSTICFARSFEHGVFADVLARDQGVLGPPHSTRSCLLKQFLTFQVHTLVNEMLGDARQRLLKLCVCRWHSL